MSRIRAFAARWQELLVWLPLALVIIVGAFYAIPRLDPRSGVDGFGELWAALVIAFKALLAAFVAWLCQRTYMRELDDEDEEFLGWAALGELPEAEPSTGDAASAYGMPDSIRKGTTRREDEALQWRARNALRLLLIDRGTWFAIFLTVFAALSAWF